MDVVNMSLIHHRLKAKLIRLAVTHSAFYTTTGHPHAKTVRVVVATRCVLAFAERHSAKLASPHNQR